MQSRSVEVETPDGRCDSFIAYPSEEGVFPGVLMGMDAFGPRPYLHEMARTLAAQGYFVLLPNFFYRTKRAPVTDKPFPLRPEDVPQVIRGFRPLVEAWTMDQRQVDATAYLKFLGQQKQVRAGKIGITGYCMGGVFALRTAAWFPDRVAAAASFHAGNETALKRHWEKLTALFARTLH